MRYLGIDYGTKRIGLALSDESMILATPFEVLKPADFWHDLKDLITEYSISHIVIGLPLNLNGSESEKTIEARDFAQKVKKRSGLEVDLVDERYTSVQASEYTEKGEVVDAVAASIILQTHLDSLK